MSQAFIGLRALLFVFVKHRMGYQPRTPFRRTDALTLIVPAQLTDITTPAGVDKWLALRTLTIARSGYGLSNRDLSVLQALLSFHPKTVLGGPDDTELPIVFASNKAICARLNGMPCSTMRRHIAKLVDAGFLIRRDSPNGKRYARAYAGERVAFGFDLTPLATRFNEVERTAREIEESLEKLKQLRETVMLMRRDLSGLIEYGAGAFPEALDWQDLGTRAQQHQQSLRRKLDCSSLEQIEDDLEKMLRAVEGVLLTHKAEKLSTTDAQNEQHQQRSKKEDCRTKAPFGYQSTVPLDLVTSTCREYQSYCQEPVRNWDALLSVADLLRPMMGVTQEVWLQAVKTLGKRNAAVVLIAILERFNEIKSPGAYLRSLAKKAENGAFSTLAMILSLSRRQV